MIPILGMIWALCILAFAAVGPLIAVGVIPLAGQYGRR